MAKVLTGKVALVTGGSRGIGAAIAMRLACDGADIAVSYAASADTPEAVVHALEGHGIRAAGVRADQGDAARVDGPVKAVVQRFGRLDTLALAASGPVADINPVSCRRGFDSQPRNRHSA